ALDYNRQTRKDKFVGYANYTRNRYQAQASYGDKKKRKLQASLGYWTRNYPNTFAFDKTIVNNLPSPKTDYEAFDFKASGEMPLYKAWVFWGEFESTRQEVTDPRYDFDRYQITAGVKIDL
ncbi:MAG: hypothetical protein ACE5FU_10645, partial [Nitrospinota bacterium]